MTVKDKKIVKKLKSATSKVAKAPKGILGILKKIGGYFKGSWIELRQVRWPDRKSTWGMTLAVIIFAAFFVILILLLDDGFNQLFKLILK